jgi:hypothetical protein
MQEHLSLIKRASAWSRKDSWTAPAHILEYLEVVALPFIEDFHKEAHLYCNGP